MNQLRVEAERLRDQGYSYNMISEALGVSKSTMSYWFKDRPFMPNETVVGRINYNRIQLGARKHDQKVRSVAETREAGAKEVGRLSRRDLWMLGLGIYMGEGAKALESVRVSNSDPAVISVAIRWLKECCGLVDSNIKVRLHIYPDNDAQDSLRYWTGITGLPEANFYKSYIDMRQNKKQSRRRTLPFGTAHIIVVSNGDASRGVSLHRKIAGWMAGAAQQI